MRARYPATAIVASAIYTTSNDIMQLRCRRLGHCAAALKICIHRGTAQIGGTCVELESHGQRIVVDLGLPLDAGEPHADLVPPIAGLQEPDRGLLAIMLSHGHRDHWGLIPFTPARVPVFMGRDIERILAAAAPFVPGASHFGEVRHLIDQVPLTLGPFQVTPYLVDHSAFDAYALLIEADGKRVFYSGDFRGHGRKSDRFERLLAAPPADVDVLLMEGSSIGRIDKHETFPTETDLEAAFVRAFRETAGMALICASAQNIDRVVGIFRACKQTGRRLLLDLYAAEVLAATGNDRIPQTSWKDVALFTPDYQRRAIARRGWFDKLDRHKRHRLFPERLKPDAGNLVMLFRPPMLEDLERADCLGGSRLIWSQWHGYLENEAGRNLLAAMARHDIPVEHIHTSGHASIVDLKRFSAAVAPRRLVPIHSFETQRFPEFFANVEARQDGEWWEV